MLLSIFLYVYEDYAAFLFGLSRQIIPSAVSAALRIKRS